MGFVLCWHIPKVRISHSSRRGWGTSHRLSSISGDVSARHQPRVGITSAAPNQPSGSGMGGQRATLGAVPFEHHHSRTGDGCLTAHATRPQAGLAHPAMDRGARAARLCRTNLGRGYGSGATMSALHIPDPKPYRDLLIAATALVHRLTVVTRNRADFEPMAVNVLNHWDDPLHGIVHDALWNC